VKGALIVFSEARTPGCDDFDRTDLVYKRSEDNGKTWSTLKTLVKVDAN
jgi:sialidase-1